jgi:hypothetical protein
MKKKFVYQVGNNKKVILWCTANHISTNIENGYNIYAYFNLPPCVLYVTPTLILFDVITRKKGVRNTKNLQNFFQLSATSSHLGPEIFVDLILAPSTYIVHEVADNMAVYCTLIFMFIDSTKTRDKKRNFENKWQHWFTEFLSLSFKIYSFMVFVQSLVP